MVSETEPVDREIVITHTAKSKAFRLRSERQLRSHVRNQPGAVYRKGDSDEYHVVKDGQAIVVVVEPEKYVVVTQMHSHPDYTHERLYQEVGGLP